MGFKNNDSIICVNFLNQPIILKEHLKKVESFNSILEKTFKMPKEYHFRLKSMPLTVGAIVNSIWEKFLNYNKLDNSQALKLSLCKLSILNPLHKNYESNQRALDSLNEMSSLAELEYVLDNDNYKSFLLKSLLVPGIFKYTATQNCSIKSFMDRTGTSTLGKLALRTGGRSVNERPNDYRIRFGADVDVASAYSSVMRRLTYPLGIPNTYSVQPNTKKLTLKEFFLKYKLEENSKISSKISFFLSFFQNCFAILTKIFDFFDFDKNFF